MKHYITLLTLLLAPLAELHAADTFLIENGQPRAEIIISDKPQRSTRLAARELQAGIQKISGARLHSLPPTATPSASAKECRGACRSSGMRWV